jgi:hypothetical protein
MTIGFDMVYPTPGLLSIEMWNRTLLPDTTALTYQILFRIFNPRKRKFLVRQAKLDEFCWLRR